LSSSCLLHGHPSGTHRHPVDACRPACARSAPDRAKTRGDNVQGGAHRHLQLPRARGAHRQTSTLPRTAYNDRVVGTPASTVEREDSCPLRVRPAHRAQVCAGGGARAVGSWPRRRGRPPGRQRVHPPVASARQSRAPALGRPAPSLTSDGAQACSMHVTVCMHVASFLKMCRKAQEGTRAGAGAGAGAGSLYLLLSFPDTRRRARALSLSSLPRALCARSDQIVETVDQILAAFPLTLCPPKTKSQVNVTSV